MGSYFKKLVHFTDDNIGSKDDHKAINTPTAGKTIRFNSITKNDITNDFIGFQSKPGFGTTTTKVLTGGEISPRLNDGVGADSVIGQTVVPYLKGTSGNLSGDLRGQQIELVDDNAAGRTISGYATHLRIRSNLSCAITGKYSVLRVENEEGSKAMDALIQFTTGSGCLVEGSGTVGGTQDRALKVLIGTTTYYIPMHTTVS